MQFPRENNAEGRLGIAREPVGVNSEAEGHWFESSSARHCFARSGRNSPRFLGGQRLDPSLTGAAPSCRAR